MCNDDWKYDDEREALLAAKDALRRLEKSQSPADEDALRTLVQSFESVISQRDSLRLAWEDAEANVAGLLSSLRGEEPPRIGCNICGERLPDGEPHLCPEPQGEPSDAQVDAARDAYYATWGPHEIKIRAALRAAGGVR